MCAALVRLAVALGCASCGVAWCPLGTPLATVAGASRRPASCGRPGSAATMLFGFLGQPRATPRGEKERGKELGKAPRACARVFLGQPRATPRGEKERGKELGKAPRACARVQARLIGRLRTPAKVRGAAVVTSKGAGKKVSQVTSPAYGAPSSGHQCGGRAASRGRLSGVLVVVPERASKLTRARTPYAESRCQLPQGGCGRRSDAPRRARRFPPPHAHIRTRARVHTRTHTHTRARTLAFAHDDLPFTADSTSRTRGQGRVHRKHSRQSPAGAHLAASVLLVLCSLAPPRGNSTVTAGVGGHVRGH